MFVAFLQALRIWAVNSSRTKSAWAAPLPAGYKYSRHHEMPALEKMRVMLLHLHFLLARMVMAIQRLQKHAAANILIHQVHLLLQGFILPLDLDDAALDFYKIIPFQRTASEQCTMFFTGRYR